MIKRLLEFLCFKAIYILKKDGFNFIIKKKSESGYFFKFKNFVHQILYFSNKKTRKND